MSEPNYLLILLNGYANHKSYLDSYFYRQYKEAEKNHVNVDEYFGRLNDAWQLLYDELNKQLYEHNKPYYGYIAQQRQLGLPIEEGGKMELENMAINLFHFTNDKFRGQLNFQDLVTILTAIKASRERAANELKATTTPLTNSQPKKPKQPKKLNTFTWTGKQGKQTDLHKKMKGVFIDSKTSVKEFCNVFDGVNVNEIKQVKWKNDNATHLLQFIHLLMKDGYISKTERMNYNQIKACFCKMDGSQFEERLKNIFTPIKDNLTNINQPLLQIIKSLK